MSPNYIDLLRRGASTWNDWYRAERERRQTQGAKRYGGADPKTYSNEAPNFSGTSLRDTDLRGVDLSGCLVQESDLSDVRFGRAVLCGTNLFKTNLTAVDFTEADLTDANLGGANLSYAIFRRTVFSRTDFSGAQVKSTVFADVDLRGARGLNGVMHLAPSTIGLDTFARSESAIDRDFIYGIGVSRNLAKLIVPSEYHSCFISYSLFDEDFADKLWVSLKKAGVSCWYAPNDIYPGQKLNTIHDAISRFEKFILILSENSISSEWVKREIRLALTCESRNRSSKIIPIRIGPFDTISRWEWFDDDTGKDQATEIRQFFIADFSEWRDPRKYSAMLKRLLISLSRQ